jgi:hypothetical protein
MLNSSNGDGNLTARTDMEADDGDGDGISSRYLLILLESSRE